MSYLWRLPFWSRHPRMLVATGVAVPLVALAVFFLFYQDRAAPTEVLNPPTIPYGAVGEEIVFTVPVRRDLSRGCTLEVSRTIVDSSLQATVLTPSQAIGSDGLRIRNQIDPAYLRVRFTIPPGLPSGPARLLTDASWTCTKNPTTWLAPIQRTWDWPFIITPSSRNGKI